MDFFEHQHQAKKASTRLLVLFLLVCLVVILAVDGVFYSVLVLGRNQSSYGLASNFSLDQFVAWQLSLEGLAVASISVCIISIGCIKRWFELRKGGNGLAIHIGARSLGFASKDDKEQRLINVVEEMAIASGISPPGIYVLDYETSINAFVAGYEFEDSALIVTRGLLNAMDREELQAVVAHEFSHILHGDNRINIRLMVLVAGFVWIAELGRMFTSHGGHHRGRRQSIVGIQTHKHRQQAWAIGLPLIVIGSFGTFLGRLIRTSISRKREYLADASAVQFTRNPQAMASALNVIRENQFQGYLKNPRADELSHMCISPSLKSKWFATHPSLELRINAIDESFIKRHEIKQRKEERAEKRQEKQQEQTQATRNMYSAGISQLQQSGTEQLHNVIGSVNAESLQYAMGLHDELPYEYRQALHSTVKAKTMLFYLLFDKNDAVRKEQQAWIIEQSPDSQSYLQTLSLLAQGLPPRLALPLVELLIPVLKTLSPEEKKTCLQQVLKLAKWDGKLTIFEISLYSLLKDSFSHAPVRRSSHVIKKMAVVAYEMNVVISSLVHMACNKIEDKHQLYNRTVNILGLKNQTLLEKNSITPKQLYTTLNKLKNLSPMLKRSLMDVCGDIVMNDCILQSREYETLRLMSLLLACPMPPLPAKKAG